MCCNGACGGNDKNDCQACSAKEGASKDGVCTLRTGRTCSDGDACTKIDVCVTTEGVGAVCQGTMPVTCQATDQCHAAGVCNPRNGTCSAPALPDATVCSDGNMCTVGDACMAGVCRPGTAKACPAATQCQNVCDPATGMCNPPKADGTPCDDSSKCTAGQDVCKAGMCTGPAKVCPVPGACHLPGACDPVTGVCSNPLKPEASPCDDGNKCSLGDQCVAGKCNPGTQTVTCATDCRLCEPASGKCTGLAKPTGTLCSDGNSCTKDDACTAAGTCTPGAEVTCALPACQKCSPATGICMPTNEGEDCDDD